MCVTLIAGYLLAQFLNKYLGISNFIIDRLIIINIVNAINFFIAIYTFIVFKNSNIKTSKCINYIGKCTFAAYLIHDSMYRYQFWKMMQAEKFWDVKCYKLLLHAGACVIIIMLLACIIEFIRKIIFKPISMLISKIDKNKKIDKIYERMDKFMEI